MINQTKETVQGKEKKSLPEIAFILIMDPSKSDGSVRCLSLDDYGDSNHKKYYMDAIVKYGKDNVRYCRVVSARVKVDVDFG